LRVAALIKQIPEGESMTLGPDGRLVRAGLALEMNAFCRRAVSKGVELAQASGGSCTVFTLGPSSAEDVLREAVAWGADRGVHLCDPVLAGSDTLATARALAEALRQQGPFDLILAGRNSLDGETGQVGPEVAQLLDLPFATGVRTLETADVLAALEEPRHPVPAELEIDDGRQDIEIELPAVLSVAERLCEPCKVEPEGRAAVGADLLSVVTVDDLGQGPWGEAGSPTRVGAVRTMVHERAQQVLRGSIEEQVTTAVEELASRGALTAAATPRKTQSADTKPTTTLTTPASPHSAEAPIVAVVIEPGRPAAARELLGAAHTLASEIGGIVHALCVEGGGDMTPPELARAGAQAATVFTGSTIAEDVAEGLAIWIHETKPWALLAPSTVFGREVAGRVAAATNAGLVGDAIALHVHDGRLVAAKPAFAGALVADITCTSPLQMVTIRPGALAEPAPRSNPPPVPVEIKALSRRDRVRVINERRNDDVETLARAAVVIGVGAGVSPDEYELLSPLAALLGAELAATRKVTDKGWAPRARQIGITGRALSPRLYVAIGLSGKFNHMVGVRAAGTILAINQDPDALVFGHCDVGIVGDWRQVVPLLADALQRQAARA
jgi:electron transfer flavoprotein alpha subunit